MENPTRRIVNEQRRRTAPPKRLRIVYPLLPGDALEQDLNRWGIKQRPHEGCGCKKLQTLMNNLGPNGCLRRLDELVTRMRASIEEWKEGSRLIPTPPNLLIKLFIKRAIDRSFASQQILE